MKQGDISSARLLLERAMSAGDAKAAFLLAQTYDPRALRAWNVRGMRGDPDRARELYARARQSGFASAP
jgi:TPR repeat protein